MNPTRLLPIPLLALLLVGYLLLKDSPPPWLIALLQLCKDSLGRFDFPAAP